MHAFAHQEWRHKSNRHTPQKWCRFLCSESPAVDNVTSVDSMTSGRLSLLPGRGCSWCSSSEDDRSFDFSAGAASGCDDLHGTDTLERQYHGKPHVRELTLCFRFVPLITPASSLASRMLSPVRTKKALGPVDSLPCAAFTHRALPEHVTRCFLKGILDL